MIGVCDDVDEADGWMVILVCGLVSYRLACGLVLYRLDCGLVLYRALDMGLLSALAPSPSSRPRDDLLGSPYPKLWSESLHWSELLPWYVFL